MAEDENILEYGWNAIDIAVLDGTTDLFYNGRRIGVADAENLLDAPNVHPFQVYVVRKQLVPPLPVVEESQIRCSHESFMKAWN